MESQGRQDAFPCQLRTLLADGIARAASIQVRPSSIRLPARDAHAAIPMVGKGVEAETLAKKLSEAPGRYFEELLGVQPVSTVQAKNGWLYVTLRTELLTQALKRVAVLSVEPDPLCSVAVTHMLLRAGARDAQPAGEWQLPAGYPAIAETALHVLCLGEESTSAAYARAEEKLEGMFLPVPPRDRAAVRRECALLGLAAAKQLAMYQKTGDFPIH